MEHSTTLFPRVLIQNARSRSMKHDIGKEDEFTEHQRGIYEFLNLSETYVNDFLNETDVLIFDCDGVLWHGDVLLSGVKHLLQILQHSRSTSVERHSSCNINEDYICTYPSLKNKEVYYLTNNSTKTRDDIVRKLTQLGISGVLPEQIISSAYVTAQYLRKEYDTLSHTYSESKPSESIPSSVFVIGENGLTEELRLEGFSTFGGDDDSFATPLDFHSTTSALLSLPRTTISSCPPYVPPPNEGKHFFACVVGLDRRLSYIKLMKALQVLKNTFQIDSSLTENEQHRGENEVSLSKSPHRETIFPLFLATNRDYQGNFSPQQVWPGAGACVAAVEACARRRADTVGKPSKILEEWFHEKVLRGIDLKRVCIFGDVLQTDVLFAKMLGCRSCLVFSGITKKDTFMDALSKRMNAKNQSDIEGLIIPDFILNSVALLVN